MRSVEEIAKAVGHIPSGLFIVAARDPQKNLIDGYLASWVQQASFSPLIVSLAVRPGRPAYDLITQGNIFTINIIGEHEKGFMKLFWKGYDPHDNPFEKLSYRESSLGGIILTEAKSVLECRLKSKITPGDHDLVLAEVLESEVLNESAKSITYIRKSGLDY